MGASRHLATECRVYTVTQKRNIVEYVKNVNRLSICSQMDY
jgi:hypothetical protein